MFEKFHFSQRQIENYRRSAGRDIRIASDANVPEVAFRFCYDALLKLAMAVCAGKGWRVKSRRGHHIELIKKLSFYLADPDIEIIANEMRAKRNWDLYGGGVLISVKEAKSYVQWAKRIFENAETSFGRPQPKLKL